MLCLAKNPVVVKISEQTAAVAIDRADQILYLRRAPRRSFGEVQIPFKFGDVGDYAGRVDANVGRIGDEDSPFRRPWRDELAAQGREFHTQAVASLCVALAIRPNGSDELLTGRVLVSVVGEVRQQRTG